MQNSRRVVFGLFRVLPPGSCRKLPQKGKVWDDLVDLQRQHSQSTGMISLNVCKASWQRARMNTEHLTELKHKRDAHRRWKQGRLPRRNAKTLALHAEMKSGKPKLSCR